MENTSIRSIKPLPTLKTRAQYLGLRQAPRYSCEDFVLQGNLITQKSSVPSNILAPSVGYTITKKIGNSVERNRIRRRLRQAIAEAMKNTVKTSEGETSHGGFAGEMVVVARRSAIDQDYQDLVSKFTKGIDRLVAKGNKAS
jgi:ribonuclease P protein component